MSQERFIAASSPDAGEVAAEVSPLSSAGYLSIRRCSLDPPAAAPLRPPRTRQPTRSYLRVRQWWRGTCVAEIIDRDPPHPSVAR